MPRIEARQKRRDRGEAITPKPRQGWSNNHEAEARPRRGTHTSRRGRSSSFATSRPPQDETFASRHITATIERIPTSLQRVCRRNSVWIVNQTQTMVTMVASPLSRQTAYRQTGRHLAGRQADGGWTAKKRLPLTDMRYEDTDFNDWIVRVPRQLKNKIIFFRSRGSRPAWDALWICFCYRLLRCLATTFILVQILRGFYICDEAKTRLEQSQNKTKTWNKRS
jgi:hypothetical protein